LAIGYVKARLLPKLAAGGRRHAFAMAKKRPDASTDEALLLDAFGLENRDVQAKADRLLLLHLG
jgi:hypothetical protein